jgi:carboxypeptidase Taq
LKKTSLQEFYKGINKVGPSLIRTEADELTYHFHVYIRYELEKRLIEGSLKTKDIPVFWNESYANHLGVAVPSDKQGCLQDVHWSHGSFGYFPTYSLGSFFAAQFFSFMQEQNPALSDDMENGDTSRVFKWLQQNIYAYGRKYTSDQLCKKATGKPLDTSHFVNYLLQKYGLIYNL